MSTCRCGRPTRGFNHRRSLLEIPMVSVSFEIYHWSMCSGVTASMFVLQLNLDWTMTKDDSMYCSKIKWFLVYLLVLVFSWHLKKFMRELHKIDLPNSCSLFHWVDAYFTGKMLETSQGLKVQSKQFTEWKGQIILSQETFNFHNWVDGQDQMERPNYTFPGSFGLPLLSEWSRLT